MCPVGARNATGDKNEILIHGEIGWSWFGDFVTAKDVRAQLKDLADEDEVIVRINSPGGDASEGAAIYSLLRDAKQRVVVKIDGAAFSAASVIAMAGDDIVMSPVSMLMVHDPWTFAMGDASEMRKTADILDKIAGSLAAAYVRQTEKDEEEIRELMRAETWLTAAEAVAQGFADRVDEDEDEEPEPVVEDHHLERFKNAPKTIERFLKSKRSTMRIAASARRPRTQDSPVIAPAGTTVPRLLRDMTWRQRV